MRFTDKNIRVCVDQSIYSSKQGKKEKYQNYIESQKTIIKSFHSAWSPYQQNFNTSINTWNSPEAVANAYSRFVSNVADNTVTYLRTTNNIIFSNMDTMKSVMQQAKDSSKQIFNQNVNVAKTIEQNTRDVAQAAQDANTRFNTSVNNSGSGSSSNTSGTTSSTTTYTSAA